MIRTEKFQVRGLAVAVFAIVVGVACQPKPHDIRPSEKTKHGTLSGAERKALAESDLQALALTESSAEASALQEFDQANNRIFSRTFGGTSRADVKKFIDARIKHFVTAQQLDASGVHAADYGFENWPGEVRAENMKKKGAEFSAVNLGSTLWLQGQLRGQALTLPVPGAGPVTVDSPRAGIMLLAAGYSATEKAKFKNASEVSVPIPVQMRQSSIVHEARHSDCLGGVSQEDLEAILKAGDSSVLGTRNPKCMYLHATCPEGHDLAGIAACDDQAWGAYTVDAIFLEGALASQVTKDKADSQVVRTMLQAFTLDRWGRVLQKKDAVFSGSLGEPDYANAKVP